MTLRRNAPLPSSLRRLLPKPSETLRFACGEHEVRALVLGNAALSGAFGWGSDLFGGILGLWQSAPLGRRARQILRFVVAAYQPRLIFVGYALAHDVALYASLCAAGLELEPVIIDGAFAEKAGWYSGPGRSIDWRAVRSGDAKEYVLARRALIGWRPEVAPHWPEEPARWVLDASRWTPSIARRVSRGFGNALGLTTSPRRTTARTAKDKKRATEWRRKRRELDRRMDDCFEPIEGMGPSFYFGGGGGPLIECHKEAIRRRLITDDPRLNLCQSYSPSQNGVDLIRLVSSALGGGIGFYGDLDPIGFLAFAAIRSGSADLPWGSAQDEVRYLGMTSRDLSQLSNWRERLTIRMNAGERAAFRLMTKFLPDLQGLVGQEAWDLLASGRKTEIEALSSMGPEYISARIHEELDSWRSGQSHRRRRQRVTPRSAGPRR